MADDGVINEYYDKLLKTSTPHFILATVFKEVLGRDLKPSEWPQLKKIIRIYGKWIVLEALIRTGISATFEMGKSPFGYLNTVCLSLSKDNLDSLTNLDRIRQQKEKTQILIDKLSKPREKLQLKEFEN